MEMKNFYWPDESLGFFVFSTKKTGKKESLKIKGETLTLQNEDSTQLKMTYSYRRLCTVHKIDIIFFNQPAVNVSFPKDQLFQDDSLPRQVGGAGGVFCP